MFIDSAAVLHGAESPVERQVAEAVKSERVTVVHFWAPWCSNCKSELNEHGWKAFINANPNVQVFFVTIWSDKDGRSILRQAGVGGQPNFTLLTHLNPPGASGRLSEFLGERIGWLPTTWVFREGQLRYALNYGEVRFPMLQQMVDDSLGKW
ncbi:MAG: hypothetical protein JWM88_1045 [Verrucomicrobia bacterium]|nr:hypothetical protein [Verrucomicrobiota bacterium]